MNNSFQSFCVGVCVVGRPPAHFQKFNKFWCESYTEFVTENLKEFLLVSIAFAENWLPVAQWATPTQFVKEKFDTRFPRECIKNNLIPESYLVIVNHVTNHVKLSCFWSANQISILPKSLNLGRFLNFRKFRILFRFIFSILFRLGGDRGDNATGSR